MPVPYYESVFIARQEISSQQVDAIADVFTDIIKEGGGKVTKRENWGLKSLAYRIKKSRKAHYTLFNIDAPMDAIQEMERQMRLSEDVLSYITIRVDELDEEPSIQAQVKSTRADSNQDDGEFKARRREEGIVSKELKELSNENSVSGTQVDNSKADANIEQREGVINDATE